MEKINDSLRIPTDGSVATSIEFFKDIVDFVALQQSGFGTLRVSLQESLQIRIVAEICEIFAVVSASFAGTAIQHHLFQSGPVLAFVAHVAFGLFLCPNETSFPSHVHTHQSLWGRIQFIHTLSGLLLEQSFAEIFRSTRRQVKIVVSEREGRRIVSDRYSLAGSTITLDATGLVHRQTGCCLGWCESHESTVLSSKQRECTSNHSMGVAMHKVVGGVSM